jgi:hypothetical protein
MMGASFMVDADPSTALNRPADPLDVMTNLANEAALQLELTKSALAEMQARAEAAEAQVVEATTTGLLEIERLTAQRDELRVACQALMSGRTNWLAAVQLADAAITKTLEDRSASGT